MSRLHDLLDREAMQISAPPEALEEAMRPRPRPRKRLAVAAAVSALALVGSVTGAIALSGGHETVTLEGSEALKNQSRVLQQLLDAHIDARIVEVPVEPAVVGKWLSFYFAPDVPVTRSQWQGLEDQFEEVKSVVEIPESLPGPVTFLVGRSASPDEEATPIGTWNNALSVDGALYCLGLERLTPDQAAAELGSLGYQVVWVDEGQQPFNEVPDPPVGSVITWAWFREADLVDVRLSSPGQASIAQAAYGTPTEPVVRPASCGLDGARPSD